MTTKLTVELPLDRYEAMMARAKARGLTRETIIEELLADIREENAERTREGLGTDTEGDKCPGRL